MTQPEPPWEVHLNREIRKDLAPHGREVNRRLRGALERLQANPHLGKPLKGYHGVLSYRVGTPSGEFRITYRLRAEERVILVDLIKPREEIYKILDRIELD